MSLMTKIVAVWSVPVHVSTDGLGGEIAAI